MAYRRLIPNIGESIMFQYQDPITQHRRSCFAAVSRLKYRLEPYGITEEDLWLMFQTEYGVDSRTEMDPKEWARTSAILQAALRHNQLFYQLAKDINTFLVNER